MEEKGSKQQVVSENTREVMYKLLEEKLDQSLEKIELHIIHRLGKPNSFKPHPITSRFPCFSNRELEMDNARKHLKGYQDLHVFEDILKELYKLQKLQMKKFKVARGRGYKLHFSKANLDKLSWFGFIFGSIFVRPV